MVKCGMGLGLGDMGDEINLDVTYLLFLLSFLPYQFGYQSGVYGIGTGFYLLQDPCEVVVEIPHAQDPLKGHPRRLKP